MYTFYSYWNANQVRDVLNIIAMIMNGSDYLGLLKAIAVAGMLVAAGTAIVRMRGEEPLGYFIVLGLFYGILFVPRVTVTVQDMRTPTVYTVANVPLGVGFFASEASHIGKWLTETFETTFTPIDDELQYSNTGMVFGAQLMSEMQRVQPYSATLQMDLLTFIKDCVNPELLDNPSLIDEMKVQPDLWGWIGGSGNFTLNPGRMTNISDGVGGNVVLMCIDNTNTGAYVALGTRLTADAPASSLRIGEKLLPGRANLQTTIDAAIVGVDGVMMNASRSAADSIKQSVMMNMLTKGQSTIGAMMNNPSTAQIAMADAVSARQTSIQDGLMIQAAQKAMPRIRNAIELVVISVFPIVFLLIVAAGVKAGMVFKTYLMTVFWVNLWAPIYAVINYLQTSKDAIDMLSATGGGTNTIDNFSALADVAASSQHIAGMLTLSVPFIAYALVRGGEVAMNSVMSSMSGTTNAAAGSAAGGAASGNVNAGNYSWGNTSAGNVSGGNWSSGNSSWGNTGANKDDRSSSSVNPNSWKTSDQWGSDSGTTAANGAKTGPITSNAAGSSMGNVTPAVRQDDGRSNTTSSGSETAAGTRSSATLSQSVGTMTNALSNSGFSREFASTLASMMGSGTTSSFGGATTTTGGATKDSVTGDQASVTSQMQGGASLGTKTPAGYQPPKGGAQGGSAGGGSAGAPGGAAGGSGNQGLVIDNDTGQVVPMPQSTPQGANLPVPRTSGGAAVGSARGALGALMSMIKADAGISGQHSATTGSNAQTQQAVRSAMSNEESARMMQDAATRLSSTGSTAEVRSAASSFSAALRTGMDASKSAETSFGKTERAGSTSADSSSVGGGVGMNTSDAGFRALDAAGFSRPEARQALNDSSHPRHAEALGIVAATQSGILSGSGGGLFSEGNLQGPKSEAALTSEKGGAVDAAYKQGKGAVATQGGKDKAAAGGAASKREAEGHEATGNLNAGGVVQAFAGTNQAAATALSSGQARTNESAGVAAFTSYAFANDMAGKGLLGAVFSQPDANRGVATELENAMKSNPGLRAQVQQVGQMKASGIQPDESMMRDIATGVQQYTDGKK